MPAIGITGGIATGKTAFCQLLRQLLPAARFFDADQAARQLTESDQDAKNEIAAEFGSDIFSSDGHLNRARVRGIILENASKKSALERILHPRIRRQWSAEAQKHRHPSDFFFADIPLLYETGGETLCDRVVVVACSPDVQLARLLQRSSIHPNEAREMIKSQMPLTEKVKRSDHVVWNNGDRTGLEEQSRLLVGLWQQ